jgi:hypothetical protein
MAGVLKSVPFMFCLGVILAITFLVAGQPLTASVVLIPFFYAAAGVALDIIWWAVGWKPRDHETDSRPPTNPSD